MYTSTLACLAGSIALALGDPLPGGKHRFAARQGGYGYGYGYPFPPSPVSTSASGDPAVTTPFALPTGSSSGTVIGTVSASGTTSVPYGNSSVSLSGIASSTGNVIYTSYDPTAISSAASGNPSPSSNATTISSVSGYPTSFGTVTATSVTQSNVTDPGYPSLTHGPYPFPSSKTSYLASGTVGTGISQSAISIANVTSVPPTDPSRSRVYPTHGPYTRPSSGPYSYITSSIVGTVGTAVSTADPSASFTLSVNATTISASSGTAASYSPSLSASPSISVNVTSITSPAGTGSSSTIVTSTSDPFSNATSFSSMFPSGTVTGTGTGAGNPGTITASATTLGTGTKFTYTPTVVSQPSEYYYHHRRPHHGNQYYG